MHDTHPAVEITRFLVRGSRVWQSTYGCGTVIDLDRAHVRIEFDNHGSRLFARSLVRLFPVTGHTSDEAEPPATVRPRGRRSAEVLSLSRSNSPSSSFAALTKGRQRMRE